MGRRALARTLIVVAPAAVALAVATAAPAASGTAKVDVGFSIDRFVKRGSGLVANGRAVATYVGADGTTKSTTQRFTATAVVHGLRRLSSASTTCSVLYLELDKLSLTLLGLIATLNQVHLTIDADATRGVLGSCRRRAKPPFRRTPRPPRGRGSRRRDSRREPAKPAHPRASGKRSVGHAREARLARA